VKLHEWQEEQRGARGDTKSRAHALYRLLCTELADVGGYGHYEAQTGSRYIRFQDPRVGSIRIGDHRGRPRYKFRWNLWVGVEPPERKVVHGRHVTYHFAEDEVEKLMKAIRVAHKVRYWKPKFDGKEQA